MTHEWSVATAYYKATVPIWVDEVTDAPAWQDEFTKPEAKEVVEAVGAWVYCVRRPQNGKVRKEIEATMRAIQAVTEAHASYDGEDGVMLAIVMPANENATDASLTASTDDEEWEDACTQYGFEYIDYSAKGKNAYGEKIGLDRLREALEANDWTSLTEEEDLDFADLDFDGEDDFGMFSHSNAEMTEELFGMKAALSSQGAGDHYSPEPDDIVPSKRRSIQVDDLDKLMSKLLAVKEQSAEMPEAQRKKMAAQAVRDIMGAESGSLK